MLSMIGFLAVLGPLVVVHEFGHYLFARLFHVKAEVFSIGFGPRIWSRKIGETEWKVSAIPLGGYVKLLGEDSETPLSPEEQNRALGRQAPWKRFFIFFGGPLFNFLWAIVVFMAILLVGEPQVANKVGRVVQGSAAEKAGFVYGDEILAVDGKAVKRWDEVVLAVNDRPGERIKFDVKRVGEAAARVIEAESALQQGFSIYGEMKAVGEVDGLMANPRSTQVGVSNPASVSAQAGFKTGDKITSFNGQEIKTWEELELLHAGLARGAGFTIKFESEGGGAREHSFTKVGTLSDLGLHSSEMFIEKVVDSSPAKQAGLQTGDRLVSIDSKQIASFFQLREAVQKAGESVGKLTVRWERGGKLMASEIIPTANPQRDPTLKKTFQFTIGIMPMLTWAEPATVVERIWNPFVLLYKGTERMVVFTYRNIVSLGKMFTGDVSVGTLGGPILIGKLAGESISRGLIAFLNMMAVLSIGLGVLNILPVPVLDGGHLVLLALESVRGKPLTIRQMEVVQQVGLSLILLLMAVVIRNDISRLIN